MCISCLLQVEEALKIFKKYSIYLVLLWAPDAWHKPVMISDLLPAFDQRDHTSLLVIPFSPPPDLTVHLSVDLYRSFISILLISID